MGGQDPATCNVTCAFCSVEDTLLGTTTKAEVDKDACNVTCTFCSVEDALVGATTTNVVKDAGQNSMGCNITCAFCSLKDYLYSIFWSPQEPLVTTRTSNAGRCKYTDGIKTHCRDCDCFATRTEKERKPETSPQEEAAPPKDEKHNLCPFPGCGLCPHGGRGTEERGEP